MSIYIFRRNNVQTKQERDELLKDIVKSSLVSTCVVLALIASFELFFYINCWKHFSDFAAFGPWYRSCYMTLLISSVAGIVMILYCRRDYDHRYRIMKWLSPAYSILITSWALAITFLDCLKSARCSPIIIMTILLCIPACIYVNPHFYVTMNIIANLLMLSMLIWAPGGGDKANMYNFGVFMIIQTIVSRFFLSTKYRYFKSAQKVRQNERKLAESNKELVLLNEDLKKLNEEIKTQMQIQMELKIKEEKMAQQKKQAEEMTLLLVKTLSDTIEAKDGYLHGHSDRVSLYSAMIAKEMGLPEEEVEQIRYAATLHDIGKIGVPDTILNKPSRLTDEEYDIIKKHSAAGADILKNIDIISYTSDIARHHHERFDGKGYPDGLKGDENSIGARIVAVADSFDAMNSRRIYRNPLEKAVIREEIIRNRGTQFDPGVADAFIKLLDSGVVDEVSEREEALSRNPEEGAAEINEEAGKVLSAVVQTLKIGSSSGQTDLLTGLPSRGLGEERIVELMKNKPGALIFCDMDNLKPINDRFGHKCGDKALKILGDVISQYEEKGVACRVGGDEFLLYLDDAKEEDVWDAMHSISAQFKEAIEEDVTINMATISAGACLCVPSDLYSNVLSKADKALYHVKQQGKAGCYIYREEDAKDSGVHVDIEQVKRSILDAGQYDGALDVEYRQFAKMFDYLKKVCERYQHSVNIVLVTLDTGYNKSTYIDNIEQSMKVMELAIKNTIRNVDICTRYSSVQYLIVLLEAGEDNVDVIMSRIFASFYRMNSESDLIPRYEKSALFPQE